MKILIEKAVIDQALEALQATQIANYHFTNEQAITALREALAEPDIEEMTLTQIAARHEQAEQEPVNKALRIAEEALVYHTEQTRPIQKTDEAIIYLRNVMAQGVLNMAFTLEDAMEKFPEISYWHSEFLKHNATAEQAEQDPVAEVVLRNQTVGFGRTEERKDIQFLADVDVGTKLYAAPVRTKDLTDDEISKVWDDSSYGDSGIDFARAVIAKDREKNK